MCQYYESLIRKYSCVPFCGVNLSWGRPVVDFLKRRTCFVAKLTASLVMNIHAAADICHIYSAFSTT